MAVSCMRHASSHNYSNSSFIVDVAMGQMPNSIRFDTANKLSSAATAGVVVVRSPQKFKLGCPMPQNVGLSCDL